LRWHERLFIQWWGRKVISFITLVVLTSIFSFTFTFYNLCKNNFVEELLSKFCYIMKRNRQFRYFPPKIYFFFLLNRKIDPKKVRSDSTSRDIVFSSKEFTFQPEIGGNSRDEGPSHWGPKLKGVEPQCLPLVGWKVVLLVREVIPLLLLGNLIGEKCYLRPLRMMPLTP